MKTTTKNSRKNASKMNAADKAWITRRANLRKAAKAGKGVRA